ncbi:MAG: zinc ribbon domain-containing protein [Mobilicoccus sp.]|nr:zinc ribbon domain-containing protein [Mobilicoccus sp.]
MPTYAYACTACDHRFETVQSFTDDALTECPECAGRLRKLFNSVGVVFKGSGFYRNDSRSQSSSASDSSGTSSSGSNDSSSSASAKSTSGSSGDSGASSSTSSSSTSSSTSSSPASS